MNLPLLTILLFALTQTQNTLTTSVTYILPIKKDLTMQATHWPSYETNWAGRVSCNNCNPLEGDMPCNRSLPLLCLSKAESIVCPLDNIATQYSPLSVFDGGYYDSWTGGLI